MVSEMANACFFIQFNQPEKELETVKPCKEVSNESDCHDKIEIPLKSAEEKFENVSATPNVKDVNDVCIIPQAGDSFYRANIQRYIKNIQRIAAIPEELNFIDIKKFKGLDSATRSKKTINELINSIKSTQKALDCLRNDDDEFLNTDLSKDLESILRTEAHNFFKFIKSGEIDKDLIAECYRSIGFIHQYFKEYHLAIYNFAKSAALRPDRFNNDIEVNQFQTGLYELKPEERLQWIDISISKVAEESGIDNDLLLWKAEAHFLLGQFGKAKVFAKMLLGHISKADPEYAFVFQMANS